ncbi:MAG: AAA family ATPase [Candidatus Eisenbacteria bacterium]
MYCKYYGFSEDPFQLTPDPGFLYLDDVYREALAHLEYGVFSGKGYVLLTGEVGTGKTTLVHSFLDRHGDALTTAFIFSTAMNFVELLRMIHDDFDTGVQGDSEAFLLIELNRFLLKQYQEDRKTVLILDEAQNLGDELLEKIRMLSNLEARKSKLIQTVLVGQPELAAQLEQPKLRQLRQRVAVRFDVPPMNEERSRDYIEHRLSVAEAPGRGLFTDDALTAIYRHSKGIPRLVNVICSNALLLGLGGDRTRIDRNLIEEVARDLLSGIPSEAVSAPLPAAGDEALHRAIDTPALGPVPSADAPLTADEAAAYLRVSTKTTRHLLRTGVIPALKVGRGWRVLRGDLEDYIHRGGRPLTDEDRAAERRRRLDRELAGTIGRVWADARDAYGPRREDR